MIRSFSAALLAQAREHSGRRATGLILALALEVLLVLMLLTLGQTRSGQQSAQSTLTTFNLAPDPAPEEEQSNDMPPEAKPLQKPQAVPPPSKEEQPEPAIVLPSLIPMSQDELAANDISKIPERPKPPAPARRMMGPSAAGIPGDTPLIGTGPNGEPLYAAQWYREPTDAELAGYLSTASGPGWGLIACKTEPEYRVDQCVIVGEYPAGSRIANAVLQASWQFRVRPPRKGGRSLVGEWVGIRIDYGLKRH